MVLTVRIAEPKSVVAIVTRGSSEDLGSKVNAQAYVTTFTHLLTGWKLKNNMIVKYPHKTLQDVGIALFGAMLLQCTSIYMYPILTLNGFSQVQKLISFLSY